VFWYDGVANKPPLPAELGPGAVLKEEAGKFIYSRTLVFKGGTHGDTVRIIPEARMQELAPTLPKIAEARTIIDRSGRDIRLEVDGGIKVDNIGAVAAAGADTFVAGSAIFNAKDYAATIAAMRERIAARK